MRVAYLRSSTSTTTACRGGVAAHDSHGNEYELEIGRDCYASPKMVAFCALIGEIEELLRCSKSPLAEMVLSKWRSETCRLDAELQHSELESV